MTPTISRFKTRPKRGRLYNRGPHTSRGKSSPTRNLSAQSTNSTPPVTTNSILVWLCKVFGLVSTVVLGVLTVWLAFVAWVDSRCSTQLAKWTSQKDFLEHCNQVRSLTFCGSSMGIKTCANIL